jgi:CubicO group peptidase (beta-lactamase class C family)
LTHTSGLARDTTIGNNEEARFPSFEDHVKSISDTWLKHTVGERLDYSNIGFDLAAYIVQIRSGKPFAEYMKEKLFDPLDMPNSSADMVFIEPHPKRSIGHRSHFEEVPLESPYLGAGGVYTSAKEFARFIQFHLNWGKVDGQTVLDEGHMRTLYTASTTDPSIALGINIGVIANGTFGKYSPLEATKGYVLSHSGGGYGFSSVMGWLPEYGIGFLVLANSQDDDDQLGFLLRNVALRLIKKETIEKRFSFNVPACKQVKVGSHQQRPAPDTFTPYDPTWRRYTGTYKYMTSGWKLHAYARIELALGGPDPSLKVKVYENNGYLEIDGERLDEHLPGLFFTYNGECFDFRGPIPTWQNLRMKKIK